MPLLRFCVFLALCVFLSLPARAAAPNHALLEKGGTGGWLNVMRSVKAPDMEGRLVLLDFWTYGCINCMQIVPDLEYLEEKFGDSLLVIGVHSAKFKGEQANARILAAAKRFGIAHPVINDSNFAIWRAFDVKAWPTQILLGPDGQEIAHYTGEGHRAELERDITQALPSVTNTSPLSAFADTRKYGSPMLSFPSRLIFVPELGVIFVADTGHNRILGFDGTGKVHLTIGSGEEGTNDGDFATARFNQPRGLAYRDGILYVADTNNHMLRSVDFSTRTVGTLAGTGARGPALPAGAAEGGAMGFLKGLMGGVSKINPVPAKETALASPWDLAFLRDGKTLAIAMAGTHQLWGYDTTDGTIFLLAGTGAEGIDDGSAMAATLAQPSGLALVGNALYFVDAESSALRVFEKGKVRTLIGKGLFEYGHVDGAYPEARLQHPQGIFADQRRALIADTYNNTIRYYDFKLGMLWTLTLSGGSLDEPGGVVVVGNTGYIADTNGHRIVRLNAETGALTPLPLVK